MTVEFPHGECPSCGSNGRDHAPNCKEDRSRQDTRRTSAEKLERMRELMNEAVRIAAREPNNEAFKQLAMLGERGHRILDGEW